MDISKQPAKEVALMPERDTICLYGDTGDGKTTLIGEWAEHRYIKTKRKKTRLYTADPGGYRSIKHYEDIGVLEVVNLIGVEKPWEWLKYVVNGFVRTNDGKWVLDPERNALIDTFAFEGMTAFGDVLMQDAAMQASEGRNIGGQPPNFRYASGDVKWAGNSQSHFGSVQTIMGIAIQQSLNNLAANVIWTAMARRAIDGDNPNATVLGPQMCGKALTPDIPRWFNFCYRAISIPGDEMMGTKTEHRIYYDDHIEKSAPGQKGLANGRLPLDSVGEKDVPAYISPASLVKACELWREQSRKAREKAQARIDAALALT